MNLGELVLGALALQALNKSNGTSSPTPPPPPKTPDAQGGLDAGKVGGAVGTGLGALLGALGGGGGGSAAPTVAVTGTTTAVATGGSGSSAVAAGVGGTFASTVGLGGALVLGWVALVVLQFVIYACINNALIARLRWRDRVAGLNRPFWHLHYLELDMVRHALEQLGLSAIETEVQEAPGFTYPGGYPGKDVSLNGEDPRLTVKLVTSGGLSTEETFYKHRRTVMKNPFTGKTAAAKWTFLQHCARFFAARYVFELGKYGRNLYNAWPVGSTPITTWNDSAADVWAYPMVGGGVPQVAYADLHKALQSLGPEVFPVDATLDAAKLSALLHTASMVQQDPQLYVGFDAGAYSRKLYNAMGLSPGADGVTLAGNGWLLDVARFQVPSGRLVLFVQDLKDGKPMAPYLPAPPGQAVPAPSMLTSLVAYA